MPEVGHGKAQRNIPETASKPKWIWKNVSITCLAVLESFFVEVVFHQRNIVNPTEEIKWNNGFWTDLDYSLTIDCLNFLMHK